jgi:hypothetical protein
MKAPSIRSVDVQFALSSSEVTAAAMRPREDGDFDVCASYHKTSGQAFPSQETIERRGTAPARVVQELARSLQHTASRGWYHHYRGKGARRRGDDDCWWSIQVVTHAGQTLRWEGVNNAPTSIDDAYQQLLAFGMPRLRLGYYGDFQSACGTWPADDMSFVQLLCYRPLFEAALAGLGPDEVSDEARLVAREYCDDIKLLLDTIQDVPNESELEGGWGVEPSAEGLFAASVEEAPRKQMLALFGALARRPNGPALMIRAYRHKTLLSWWKRLEAIPDEEHSARERDRIEYQQMQQAGIDSEIVRLIDTGEVFTSYEGGRACNSSALQASVRIRQFVRQGLLRTVGDEYPRRYRAA